MIWLITFLILIVTQFGYIWFQWDKISNIIEVSKFAQELIGDQLKDNDHYKKTMTFKQKIAMVIINFKGLIWIPITFLFLLNIVAASLLTIVFNTLLIFF